MMSVNRASTKRQQNVNRASTEHQQSVVVGKRLPALQSHAIEWTHEWVRVVVALHLAIDEDEYPWMDGIRGLTNHIPTIILSVSFIS
jgi:hypothetical protein